MGNAKSALTPSGGGGGDRPEPGQALTNFWLAKLTINEQPSTEIELEHDDDGLPTRIGELDLFHDETTGLLLGSHVLDTGTRVTRNTFGELTALEHGFHGPPYTSGGQPPFIGHVLLEVDYERDQIGRIVRKTEQRRTALGATPTTEVFEYEYEEGSGRLIEVERDDVVVESYAYDQNGNRTSWTRGVESGTATYDDQDRLLTYGPLSFTYTANGELRTRSQAGQTVTYTYDTFSNLRAVRLADGTQIEYLIDGSNRRIGKKINGTVVQRFLYLGGLSPIAELDAAGTVTTQYVYGTRINVPDYFVRAGVTYRVVTDHLGSVRAVVDAQTGSIAQRMEYDAYGRVTLDTNPGFQPFGFAGGLWDPQTGLVRFGARDYDPETGRWTTKDPIGFAGGDLNLYGYVLGDPVNAFDPMGRATEEPGFWEGMIPIWGSGKQAVHEFEKGSWGWGIAYTALAISDVALVKTAATAVGKGAWKAGSHTWRATRSWYGRTRDLAPGQHVHHWAIERNSRIGKLVPDSIKNQPWNLKPLDPPPGVSMDRWHKMVEGKVPGLNPAEQWWHGTPDWLRYAEVSTAGRVADALRGPATEEIDELD